MNRKALLTIVLAVVNLLANANGDPVAKMSSINRVSNPEPLSIPEIRIVDELLKITHVDGYNCFDVTYLLKNESSKEFHEIDYGFPIDYLVLDELESYQFYPSNYSESIYEVGWNEKLIKDISFTFNDVELPFHCAKESIKATDYERNFYSDDENDLVKVEGINRRWFYTQFAMKPHEESTLNVRYKVYANVEAGASDGSNNFWNFWRKDISEEYGGYDLSYLNRYSPKRLHILYDFTPAKHFGNNGLFSLQVDIDLNNLYKPHIRYNNCWLEVNRIERSELTFASKIKPIDLTIYLSDNSSDINAAVDKYAIPETKYRINKNNETISIDFQEPIFVSDLACDMDTTGVNRIDAVVTRADGQQKQYRFERYDFKNEFYAAGNTPTLLTITDIYDEMTSKKTNDDLRIKSIKLSFDSAPASSLKALKVIDGRFLK